MLSWPLSADDRLDVCDPRRSHSGVWARCLAPWVVLGQDACDSGRDLLAAVLAYAETDIGGECKASRLDGASGTFWPLQRVDDEEAQPMVLRVGRELACLSALLSVAGPLPATVPGLLLAGAKLGPFTSTTYTLSVLATSVLTVSIPVLLFKHPEMRQRKPFRAVSVAVAAAAVGQIAFMSLSLTPNIALFDMLPGVTVSDFMTPMQHPFMVIHLVCHAVQLPMMTVMLGRLAGRSVADMSSCHYSVALYSISAILSAATKETYFRWPLLVLGSLCLKRGLAELEDSSKFVETIAPRNPAVYMWTEKHKISVGLFVFQASLHPTIQSMGYLEWISTAAVQSTWTCMDVLLTAGVAFISLKEGAHMKKSEEFMARKERVDRLYEAESID